MKHLGDITQLSGFDISPVDVVTGGSPCQDLSIAGKRAGLAGDRSGLFMEQIRIVKELRKADATRGRTNDAIRPRWMVWENVAGAFSSNHGEDFRAVLEETARIADRDAAIPRPTGGKWANAGAIVGDGWSIAWRVHDAQFWGVPQRRKRIAVVADFAGECAAEILFERESVCGDFASCGESWQGTTAGAEMGAGNADTEFNGCITPWDCQSKRIFSSDAKAYQSLYAAECSGSQNHGVLCVNPPVARSLTARHDGSPCMDRGYEIVVAPAIAHSLKAKANLSFREDSDTLICAAFMGGQGAAAGGIGYAEECSPTLKSTASGGNSVPCLCLAGNTIDRQPQNGDNGCGWQEDVAYTLTALDRHAVLPFDTTQITSPKNGSAPKYGDPCHPLAAGAHAPAIAVMDARGNENGAVCPTLTGDHQNSITEYTAIAVNCRNHTTSEVRATLQAKENGGPSLNYINPVMTDQGASDDLYVRRLTPTECERLQGYPDGWTNIGEWVKVNKKGKKITVSSADSLRYRALGNSIALPFWRWMLARIMAHYDRPATLGSLFDGIGGFPLCWQQVGGVAVWASEIEEFPIAVTKVRFGEE